VSAWIGFIFVNYSYYQDKEIVEKRIIATGINPKTIRLNERHEVDNAFFATLNEKQKIAVEEYNYVTSKTNGAVKIFLFLFVINLLFSFILTENLFCTL
jgi:hypothetical protein